MGAVISVDNVTANDAGEYRCEVMTEAGAINDSITIRGEGCKLERKSDLVLARVHTLFVQIEAQLILTEPQFGPSFNCSSLL